MSGDGVHLRRTEERGAAIEALTARSGGAVGVAGVLAALDREARRVPVPGLAVSWGFAWQHEDAVSPRWWPQGVTNSAHVPDVDRPLLVTSWYAKDGRGSRITLVDRTTLRYRHVLLVETEQHPDGVRLRPLLVHAGGIVWAGRHLYVAGTLRGLAACRLDDIVEVPPSAETFGHRFVLPVRSGYDATGAVGAMRYSFLSLDRSSAVPHLVAGEYGRGAMTRRIVRYALDPETYHLAAEADGVSRPVSFDERGLGHMQGLAIVGGRYHVSASRGPWKLGAVHVGRPGDFRAHRHATPVGPEDLCYWDDGDALWSLSEYPHHRYVYCLQRSTFD